MLHWAKLLIWITLAVPAFGAEVVFIEVHQAGRVIQLEPNGRFYHVAIRYKGRWLHAHPHRGVDLVDKIEDYGDRFLVLRNSSVPDPSDEFVQAWLGKPFDRRYVWNNPAATYCTRLVADILNVPPRPMLFQSQHWQNHFDRSKGAPGLSPDELFAELVARNFSPVADCEEDLEPN